MDHYNQGLQDDLTPHPSDAELRSYLDDRLAGSEHEEVQSHLVDCDQCLSLLKDMKDFFDPQRPAEQMISEDINSEWTRFRNQTRDDGAGDRLIEIPGGGRRESRFNSASLFGIAALLLVVLALGLWALSQRRQKQQLAARIESEEKRSAQLQAEQQNLGDQIRRLEQEKLDLQERARLAAESRNAQPKETRKPELNVPIYDLYARDFTRRSGNTSEVNILKVPPSANSVVLILNGEGVADSSSYEIEIINDRGQAIWRGKGLKKGHLGNLTVTVDRALLANGAHRLRLHGQSGSQPAEYVIRVD